MYPKNVLFFEKKTYFCGSIETDALQATHTRDFLRRSGIFELGVIAALLETFGCNSSGGYFGAQDIMVVSIYIGDVFDGETKLSAKVFLQF